MNQYMSSIIPIDCCKSTLIIVFDNAKSNKNNIMSVHVLYSTFSSPECIVKQQQQEVVPMIPLLEKLPALRPLKKLPMNKRRTTCQRKNSKGEYRNNKKCNVLRSNSLMISSSFFKNSSSKRRLIHAVDECMSIINDNYNDDNELQTNDTSKRLSNNQSNNNNNNRKTKSERWGNSTNTKSIDSHVGMKNHTLMSFIDRRDTSSISSALPNNNTATSVIVSHVQHHMDNDHPSVAVIPPKMPSRRSSLLQMLKSSSSSIRRLAVGSSSINHHLPRKQHIATSELKNASW